MQYRDFAEMYAVETNHWWFAGKRTLFKRLLRERLARSNLRILDIGCGTGAAAVDFSSFGWLCAVDRSRDALAFARSRGLQNVVGSDAASLPFAEGSFDLVIAFDVIEHVDDDRAMMSEIKRILSPGGAVAIHVPAWPFLWSRHDEVLQHKRRYTRRSLRTLIFESGFTIEHLGWASAAIFPPAVLLRTFERIAGERSTPTPSVSEDEAAALYVLPRPLNAAVRAIYMAEAALSARVGLPFGLSLAAIVTR
jgi:SAM-dependent methyltransferase